MEVKCLVYKQISIWISDKRHWFSQTTVSDYKVKSYRKDNIILMTDLMHFQVQMLRKY